MGRRQMHGRCSEMDGQADMISISVFGAQRTKEWSQHQDKWNACKACPLGRIAHRHVLGRGQLPCQVLFVGEAPGKTENLRGAPFVGKAGVVLDRMLADLFQKTGEFTYCITNTVACRPSDWLGGPNRPPSLEEMTCCKDRLSDMLRIAAPKVVVALGKIADGQLQRIKEFKKVPRIVAVHPAYIARKGGIGSDAYNQSLSDLALEISKHGKIIFE